MKNNKLPKIIITLGPASLNTDFLSKINKFNNIHLLRVNLSHTKIEDLPSIIELIRAYTDIPICLDSEGAQLRCQEMIFEGAYYSEGLAVKISNTEILGNCRNISFSPPDIAKQFEVGDKIAIGFNACSILIKEKHPDFLLAEVINNGEVKSNRAASIDRKIDLPSITDKDKEAFRIGIKYGIKHYALSFTNRAEDVELLRSLLPVDAIITSKIESINGLTNLDSILAVVDDILIDRGDLSYEVTIETIPFLQKLIIERAIFFNKPVYVATNLLESMVDNHYPTRAEANDIISTLNMGANGLVLAAETAIGKYPEVTIDVIETLCKYHNKWKRGATIKDILSFCKLK